jgi:uncharacterized protein (TIGR03032 family)
VPEPQRRDVQYYTDLATKSHLQADAGGSLSPEHFALADGRIRYATAFAAADAPRGYRHLPLDSGVLIDVEANAIAAQGLLKPHSVRLFGDELYVLNSAAGEVLRVDLQARRSDVLADLPGFTRGLRAVGDVLLVGLSALRPSARPLNLPVEARSDALVTGIAAIDRGSGKVLGRLRFPESVTEVFDFVTVPRMSAVPMSRTPASAIRISAWRCRYVATG